MPATHLHSHRVRALFNLLGETRELVAAGEDPIEHMAGSGLRLLDADAGGIVLGVDMTAPGDNLMKVVTAGFSTSQAAQARALYTAQHGSGMDPAAAATMARWPSTVVGHRRALVDDHTWYGSAFVNEHRRAWRLDDSIYSSGRSKHGIMQGLGYFRAWGSSPFGDEDVELARLLADQALEVLPAPLVALSPRERETLRHLLTGASAKQIASRMELSLHTVNEYVKGVYRAERVQSRAELLAKHRV